MHLECEESRTLVSANHLRCVCGTQEALTSPISASIFKALFVQYLTLYYIIRLENL